MNSNEPTTSASRMFAPVKGKQRLSYEDFEIISQVGEGTYGRVYKARHIQTHKLCALKVVNNVQEEEGLSFTAIREIRYLQQLSSNRNVIGLQGTFYSRDEELVLVFEYMEHDLSGLLSLKNVQLSPAQIKCLMKQLLEGLHQCHQQGIMHRDIKAANLLLSNGVLKLADFGLASNFARRKMFSTNVVTLWYRAPELLLGQNVYGPKVDMWSAGCIFIELLTRQSPFPGNDEREQMEHIFRICGTPSESVWPGVSKLENWPMLKDMPVFRNRLRETFGAKIDDLALSLLSKLLTLDPNQRFDAAQALDHDYFWKDPMPCDPSALPRYPAMHEYEAKKTRQNQKEHISAKKQKTHNFPPGAVVPPLGGGGPSDQRQMGRNRDFHGNHPYPGRTGQGRGGMGGGGGRGGGPSRGGGGGGRGAPYGHSRGHAPPPASSSASSSRQGPPRASFDTRGTYQGPEGGSGAPRSYNQHHQQHRDGGGSGALDARHSSSSLNAASQQQRMPPSISSGEGPSQGYGDRRPPPPAYGHSRGYHGPSSSSFSSSYESRSRDYSYNSAYTRDMRTEDGPALRNNYGGYQTDRDRRIGGRYNDFVSEGGGGVGVASTYRSSASSATSYGEGDRMTTSSSSSYNRNFGETLSRKHVATAAAGGGAGAGFSYNGHLQGVDGVGPHLGHPGGEKLHERDREKQRARVEASTSVSSTSSTSSSSVALIETHRRVSSSSSSSGGVKMDVVDAPFSFSELDDVEPPHQQRKQDRDSNNSTSNGSSGSSMLGKRRSVSPTASPRE